MLRATSLLLLVVGTTLIVVWGAAPAQSQQRRPSTASMVASPDPPELGVVRSEVERLVSRLDRDVTFAVPARDPFHFAASPRATRDLAPPPDAMPVALVEPAAPEWPSLVAIVSPPDGGVLEVALSDRSDELHVVRAGQSVGQFLVTEIGADSVALSEPASGRTTRLALR